MPALLELQADVRAPDDFYITHLASSHSPSVGCDGSSCHESWKPVRTELCLLLSTHREKEWSWPGQPVTSPHHACATEACQEPVDRRQNDSISDLCLHLEGLPIVPNILVKWYLFHVISVLLFGHQNIFIHWEWENGKCSFFFTIQHGRLGDIVHRMCITWLPRKQNTQPWYNTLRGITIT